MKKFFTTILALLVVCSSAFAQLGPNVKPSKDSKKKAKALVHQGWETKKALGLETQLEMERVMSLEYDESGFPKYFIVTQTAISQQYATAKSQATQYAKEDIAGLIESEVTSLIETTRSNENISPEDAVTIQRSLQVSKALIAQKLSRIIEVRVFNRTLANKNVEVEVTIAYNADTALALAKEAVKSQLESKGEDLHNQLDVIWSTRKN